MMPCPPDDVLGALVQQELDDGESERVRLHIDECGTCAQALAAAVRGRAMATDAALLGKASGVGPVLAPELRDALPVDAMIGRYRVRQLLGAGGMGRVYEAYDAELDRAIALKVLRPELAVAQSLTERLVRESRLMAKISHPGVITVYDVGRTGQSVFIAMELIRGETLGAYVARARPRWRDVVELYERAGAGLAAAHRAGIVHRDFKPDNALVELVGGSAVRVVVTDFGIARATSIRDDHEHGVLGRRSDPHLTSAGAAIGTPAYMAPEQLDGSAVDLRADVFAFAASLWEALFGVRPFPGQTVDEIRAAMTHPPQAPGRYVPRGVVRVLQRGLAIDPGERWQDMTAFVRELLILRARRRRVQIAAGALGLVGASIAGAVLLARPAHEDPCARATLAVDMPALRAAIAEPEAHDVVVTKIEGAVGAWRATHAATCHADRQPNQAATTTACLEARKLEITGVVADLIADRGTHATRYIPLIGDPSRCAQPAPGDLVAKVPDDPILRRRVTALRYRAFSAETARDRGEFASALAGAGQLVAEAEHTWPFVHAETLYLLGTAQSMGGDTNESIKTLKRAAAVADAAHHDYIVANVWIQLALSASFDAGDPERGLEYVTYAEAAVERLGHPPLVTSLLEYVKGATLSSLARFAEAERSLRHAVDLAEDNGLANLPEALQGLAFLYQEQGRYSDAVDAYRVALGKVPDDSATGTSSAITFRQQLASNLSMLGRAQEAEAYAREAVAIADQKLPPENIDRAIARAELADVLQQNGSGAAALVEVRAAERAVVAIEGDRSGNYGRVLSIEANILQDLERHAEASALFVRACELIAFQGGDASTDYAACELSHAIALGDTGRHAAALAIVERALPVLVESYGEAHPQAANAHLVRGMLRFELGQHTAGIADLERAVAAFEKATLDPGHLAAARWSLARALWKRDHRRARALLDQALEAFSKASGTWASQYAEARALLARDNAVKQRYATAHPPAPGSQR